MLDSLGCRMKEDKAKKQQAAEKEKKRVEAFKALQIVTTYTLTLTLILILILILTLTLTGTQNACRNQQEVGGQNRCSDEAKEKASGSGAE